MARPVRSGRAPSTTMLFRITIQRPRRRFGRARSRLRARRARRYAKSVRFRSSGRPLPPFFIFMQRHRRRLQRKYPNLSMVQTAKRLGSMWRRLPERDKEMYKDMADYMRGRREGPQEPKQGPEDVQPEEGPEEHHGLLHHQGSEPAEFPHVLPVTAVPA